MPEKKIDRRALKTQKAIREGLCDLLCEKELRSITVQELSDRADIHRVTFYKHYMDIYDVYEQLEKDVLTELGLLILENGEMTSFDLYPAVLQYVTDNPKVFRMIFSPHSPGTLYQKLQNLVEGLNRNIWSEFFDVDLKDSRVDYAIRYHSNGCLAIIAAWVQSDFSQPADYIIQTLSGLDESTQRYLTTQIDTNPQ